MYGAEAGWEFCGWPSPENSGFAGGVVRRKRKKSRPEAGRLGVKLKMVGPAGLEPATGRL